MLSVFRVFRVLQVFRVPLGGTHTPPDPEVCPMKWENDCVMWDNAHLSWS